MKPGIQEDMSVEQYHADPAPTPSLSSSVLSTLLDKSPLHAWRMHRRLGAAKDEVKKEKMDFGSAAHRLLLGAGSDMHIIDAPDYRTKIAKEARDAAYEDGLIPILKGASEKAHAMVAAAEEQLDRIPYVAEAFYGDKGNTWSELPIFWQEQGMWCRALIDRLLILEDGTAIHVDYKTTEASAAPAAVGRRLYQMNYDLQSAWYRRGIMAALPSVDRVRFFLVSQEVQEPFALSSVTLDEATWVLAEKRIRHGLALWRRCLNADHWPGYPPVTATAALPPWIENAWLEREIADEELASLACLQRRAKTLPRFTRLFDRETASTVAGSTETVEPV